MKKCRNCLMEKPLEEFFKAPGNTDGHNTLCKPCHKVINKLTPEQRERRRIKYIENKAEITVKRRKAYHKDKEALRSYKMARGCAKCGWNLHHAGLQFDHIIPRSTSGDYKINSMNELQKQKDNIQVLCGGCNSASAFEQGLLSANGKISLGFNKTTETDTENTI